MRMWKILPAVLLAGLMQAAPSLVSAQEVIKIGVAQVFEGYWLTYKEESKHDYHPQKTASGPGHAGARPVSGARRGRPGPLAE